MYESYWGLQEKPFENTPDPRFMYLTDAGSELHARMLYALQSNRGAAMITSESGCGKTLLARSLVHQLDPDATEVALLTNPRWSAEEFLREVLYQLGDGSGRTARSEVIHRLNEVLFDNYSAGKNTLVLIDEGQLIEDTEVLEEIRLLLNFQLNDAFLVTLMLVGQPDMARRVRQFRQLDQRIAARGALEPLTQDEVAQYVRHRLRVAGREQPIFDEDCISLIHDYSEGIPRRINNICDIALVVGYSRKRKAIEADWLHRLIQTEGGDAA